MFLRNKNLLSIKNSQKKEVTEYGRNLRFLPSKKSIFGLLSATTTLIILNVLAFIMFLILLVLFRNNTQSLYDFVALSPLNILHGKYLWTFITSMFMHGNLAHLFFNMFSLAFIGSFVEKIIGRKRFISFYLISGLFAGIVFVALSGLFGNSILGAKIFGDPNISGVGASGAIFGLLSTTCSFSSILKSLFNSPVLC